MPSFQETAMTPARPLKQGLKATYQGMDLRALVAVRETPPVSEKPAEILQQEEDQKKIQASLEEQKKNLLVLQEAVLQLKEENQKWKEDAAKEVTEILFVMVGEILKSEFSKKTEKVQEEIRSLIEETSREEGRTLLLNPEDYQALEQAGHENFLKWIAELHVTVLKEATVMRGACRIQTPTRRFEADPYKRVDWIKNRIFSKVDFSAVAMDEDSYRPETFNNPISEDNVHGNPAV